MIFRILERERERGGEKESVCVCLERRYNLHRNNCPSVPFLDCRERVSVVGHGLDGFTSSCRKGSIRNSILGLVPRTGGTDVGTLSGVLLIRCECKDGVCLTLYYLQTTQFDDLRSY